MPYGHEKPLKPYDPSLEPNIDVRQFEGRSPYEARQSMLEWTDEQLTEASEVAEQLRVEKEQEARLIQESARDWRNIASNARDIIQIRRRAEERKLELQREEALPELAENAITKRVKSFGGKVLNSLTGLYHPDMFR